MKYHELDIENIILSQNIRLRNEWWKVINSEAFSPIHQTNGAKKLCKEAKIKFDKPFHASEFQKMQDYLATKGFQLVIIDATDHLNYYFKGEVLDKQICLELNTDFNGHFNYIKKMSQYLESANWCNICYRTFTSIIHICEYGCKSCGNSSKCDYVQFVDCDACNRSFKSYDCYVRHKTNTCKGNKCCETCNVLYYVKNDNDTSHKCFEYLCKICGKTYTESPHYCMLKPVNISRIQKEDEKNKIIVTFDIESTLKHDDVTGRDMHYPNLLIAGKFFYYFIQKFLK
jgi:hypothetical protein